MARKVLIQIYRGAETAIGTLNPGELGYCADTRKLYIGSSTGNVLLVAAESSGDMLKSIYDTDNNGVVDAAETVPWSGVIGKPAAFPPSAHSHGAADIMSGTVAAARLPAGSTSNAGIVQLNSSTTSASTTQAATPSAVKAAYDLAVSKLSRGVMWDDLKGV